MKRTYQPNNRKKAKKHGFFARKITNILNNTVYITNKEKDLILLLLNNLENGNFDKNYFVNKWSELPKNESLDNHLSLAIIELTQSVINFVNSKPEVFGTEDDEIIQAIFWHVAGAVAGGTLGVLIDCAEDVIYNTGYGDVNAKKALKRSFVKGAIAGAIASI